MRINKMLSTLTLSAALLAGSATAAHAAQPAALYDEYSIYARAAVVVAVDEQNEIVTVQDAAGFRWSFYSDGAGDWSIGDGVSLTMYDNGTPESILDDVVVNARYERFDLLPNA